MPGGLAGLASVPGGYDTAGVQVEDIIARRLQNQGLAALGRAFSDPSFGAGGASIPQSLPPPSIPSASSFSPSAFRGGQSAVNREAAAVRAGTWQVAPDYEEGLKLAQPSLENPPAGGPTLGGAPGAPYSAVMGQPVPPSLPAPGAAPPAPRPGPGAGGAPSVLAGGAPGGVPVSPPRPPPSPPAPGMPFSPPPGPPTPGVMPARPANISRETQPGGGGFGGPPTFQQLAQQIARANPGIEPGVLGAAMQLAAPLMQSDSRMWYRLFQSEMAQERLQQQLEIAKLNLAGRRDVAEIGAGSREKVAEIGAESREKVAGMRPEVAAMQRFYNENPDATLEEATKYFRTLKGDDTKKEIATAGRESREEIAGAGRESREKIAEAGRESREKIAGANIDARKDIAKEARESRERVAAENRALRERLGQQSLEFKQQALERNLALRKQLQDERLAAAQERASAGKASADDIEGVAKAIAEYRLNPASASSYRQRLQIMERVQQINPKYNQAEWTATNQGITRFTTGQQGDAVRYLKVAENHLQTLEPLVNMLGTGDVRGINAVINYINKNWGADTGVTNFETARHFVASEVSRAAIGARGALGDRAAAEAPLVAEAPANQLKGTITTYRKLMKGQLDGLETEWNAIPGAPKDFKQRFNISASDLNAVEGPERFKGFKVIGVTPPASP